MFKAWLIDLDPQPPYLFILWHWTAEWCDFVESWDLPGPYSIHTAETSLAEHGWRRLSDWHRNGFGHAAYVTREPHAVAA